MSGAATPRDKSPQQAELVADLDDGALYLRAGTGPGSPSIFQPVPAQADVLPDSGIWQGASTVSRRYFAPVALYRFKGGAYRLVEGGAA